MDLFLLKTIELILLTPIRGNVSSLSRYNQRRIVLMLFIPKRIIMEIPSLAKTFVKADIFKRPAQTTRLFNWSPYFSLLTL